jgi:hypothetical protein
VGAQLSGAGIKFAGGLTSISLAFASRCGVQYANVAAASAGDAAMETISLD